MPPPARQRPVAGALPTTPQRQLREARLKQDGVQRLQWIALSVAVVLAAVALVSPGFLSWPWSSAAKSPPRLQEIHRYGFPSEQTLPIAGNIAAESCPLPERKGSRLDCFFDDLYAELASSDPLGHGDTSLGFEGTYGEITPEGVRMLLDLLQVDVNDTFYDLGSGTGKVVLQAFLTTPCRRAVGIELSTQRHHTADRARSRILDAFNTHSHGSRLHFEQGDASLTSIEDATVIFMCSLCFPDVVMRKIARHLEAAAQPGTIVLSLKPFDDYPGMTLLGHISLPMTWTNTFEMLVYVVAPSMSTVHSLMDVLIRPFSDTADLRRLLRASAAQGFQKAAADTIGPHLQAIHGEGSQTLRLDTGTAQQLLSWPVERAERLFRLIAAHEAGVPSFRTALAFSTRVKDRARELVTTSQPQVRVDSFAKYLLARIQGDDESSLECIVHDLWPKTSPKLSPEEAKHAFGPAILQIQMTSVQFQMMLDLITPPLGPEDVLVEARSGAGHLVIQARLSRSIGRTVGIEAIKSRHDEALEAQRKLKACGVLQGSEELLSCPLAFSALLGPGLLAQNNSVMLPDELDFALVQDPVVSAVTWPSASVIYSLTQGWPRQAMWHLATGAARALPAGALVIVTSLWPGCMRGLLEVQSSELDAGRARGTRYIVSWTTSVNLVLPAADPAHPWFSSTTQVLNELRDLLLQRLGLSEKFTASRSEWRSHSIPVSEATKLLMSFGPPFLNRSQASLPGKSLPHARFQSSLRQHIAKKNSRRSSESAIDVGEVVTLDLLVGFLRTALHGNTETPFQCLASDLDMLMESAPEFGSTGTGDNLAPPGHAWQSSYGSHRTCTDPVELHPLTVTSLLGHPSLSGRLDPEYTVLVVGDCRAAALMLLSPQGPRELRCLALAKSSLNAGNVLQEMNATFPGLLRDRHFDAMPLELALQHNIIDSTRSSGMTTIFLLAQCGDGVASQSLAADVAKLVPPGADVMIASLVQLAGTTELGTAWRIPRKGRKLEAEPHASDAFVHFYKL